MEFTAQQIADFLHGTIEGDNTVTISDVSKIEEGKPHALTFFSNPKYEHYVYETKATAIIVNNDFKPQQPVKATLIRVPNAYEALAQLLNLYEQMQPKKTGIEQPSYISPTATIGNDVYIGAFAYIADGASIADGAKIYPQAYIGDGVKIGKDTTIYAGAKIYKGCKIGDRCTIHASTVIGADGFGFAPDAQGVYHKIQQVGNVIVEDDVEIGANTCIDRATMGSTRIHKGAKLDNLIQIAHNVEVGQNTVIASQTGIAGSSKIGDNCMLGGQVGIAGHLKVANGTKFAAQTGLNSSVKKEGQSLFGSPALDYMDYTRAYVVFRHLPDLKRTVDELQKTINAKQ